MAEPENSGVQLKNYKSSKVLTFFKSIWGSLPAIANMAQRFNAWLTCKLNLPAKISEKLIGIEIGTFIVGGATLIQLDEYAAAILLWIAACFIWASKAATWKGMESRPRLSMAIRAGHLLGVLTVCVGAFAWTDIKRGDKDWTAFQQLWGNKKPNFVALSTTTEYAPGTVINDIPWLSFYTELDLIMSNPTDGSYDGIDILVRPDFPVARITQLGNLPNVSFEDYFGVTQRAAVKELGTKVATPIVFLATDAGYRVHCERIPPKQSLRIMMAIVDFKKSAPLKPGQPIPWQGDITAVDFGTEETFTAKDGTKGTYWFGSPYNIGTYIPHPNPARIIITGHYSAKSKQREVKEEIIVPMSNFGN
jgi:hypothetical protein